MKTRRIVMVCLLALVLAGCGVGGDGGNTTAETTLPGQDDIAYFCPWEYDVSAQAVQDGKLHYYFMSSEGQVQSSSEAEPEKWGDSCLIAFPNGQTMLVDCGIKVYGPILAENLKRMGVKRLDYVVVTHCHSDHQDGVFHEDNLTGSGVLDQVAVGQVYQRGGVYGNSGLSEKVETACKERGIPVDTLEMGDHMQIGEVSLQVLWPQPGTNETKLSGSGMTAALNNSAIVMRFAYGEHSSLFMADLYEEGEYAMLASAEASQFDVDLLKAPHHGGHTSSSSMLLKMTSPKVAVATGYELINIPIKSRYEDCGAVLLDDRTYGYVHVSTDGKEMTWETSREEMIPGQLFAGAGLQDDTL